MKMSRIVATGAVAAMVSASVVFGAGVASAADSYIAAGDLVEESAYPSYPDQWFLGTVTGGHGVVTSGVSGLELDASTKAVQVLNGDTPATDLLGLVAGAGIVATGDAADVANLRFQIPVFGDPTSAVDKVFTTLRPAAGGAAGLAAAQPWETSSAIPATGSTPAYAANATATLTEFEAALAAINPGTGYEILAFGAFIDAGNTVTIASITWNGNTHWFLPAPTATLTPASLTAEAMGKTGVTGVFTGFLPGENVSASFATSGSGGLIPGTHIADSNGSVTITYSTASLALGTYYLGAFGNVSDASTFSAFEITAAELADTGVELGAGIAAGSLLLLAGAAVSILAVRRRKSAAAK